MKLTRGGVGLRGLKNTAAMAGLTGVLGTWGIAPAYGNFGSLIQDPLTEAREAEVLMQNHFARKVANKMRKGSSSFTAFSRTASPEVSTTKFKQFYQDLEVHGAVGFVHKSAHETVVRDRFAELDISTEPRLGYFEAAQIARSAGGDLVVAEAPELKIYPDRRNGVTRLAYFIDLEGNEEEAGSRVIVDANTGEIVSQVSHHQEISAFGRPKVKAPKKKAGTPALAPIQVYQTNSSCQLLSSTGAPMWLDAKRCDLVVTNQTATATASASAKQAAANSQLVLQYYQTAHGRSSFDNKGSTAVSVVNVGKNFSNAFWDSRGKIMGYGAGDGIKMGDFTLAVDVAAHEMTHGVTSETAQLEYEDESGALNEAFSDYFGVVIASQTQNWVVGKKVFLDPKSPGIRNLANPSSLGISYRNATGAVVKAAYPAKYTDRLTVAPGTKCDRTNDQCWVHVNSTIFGHFGYRLFTAIGQAQSDRLMYTVLTQYLNPMSDMKDAASAVRTACKALYNAATCGQVDGALVAVGL
ncbi:MAG: M4 family metallopeptidase [Bdellovibrionales bacterium]|nr:M4 family metallopeptidase [Bdellovibrionales bacterium]